MVSMSLCQTSSFICCLRFSFNLGLPGRFLKFLFMAHRQVFVFQSVCRSLPLFSVVNRRLVSEVQRAPNYRAGGGGFKLRQDKHSGSINN